MLKPKLGIQLSAAKIFTFNALQVNSAQKINGFRVRLEAKKYGFGVNNNKIYFGVQTSYAYTDETAVVDFGGCVYCDRSSEVDTTAGGLIEISPLNDGYQDSIRIFRNTAILNFKIGIRENLGNNIFIDAYFGLGIKLRYVKHNGRIDESDELSEERHPSSQRNAKGFSVVPSLPINIKLGYLF